MERQFQHEPLRLSENSIRLVRIHGGSKQDSISLRITQYAIHKRPPYAAISYTWGSATDSRSININGRPFRVHPNLWHLLYHLRQRGESRFLWIDALCIDQQNLEERNFHVQLMGKIYDQAEFAIVWLGLPANDRREARAIDFITEMGTHRQARTGASFGDAYLTEKSKQRWINLIGFCKCRYWTRTWIIQEFLQAKRIEVLCGTAVLEWQLFDNVHATIRELHETPSVLADELLEFRRSVPWRLTTRRLLHQSSTLEELIHEFYDAECSDPKDKVYGMLGIAGDCGEDKETGQYRGPQPDYSKDVVEVYFDVVSYLRDHTTSVAPRTILYLQKSLGITKKSIARYLSALSQDALFTILSNISLEIKPDYIGAVEDIIPAWSSTRDLKQKLEQFDWAKYVGYQMARKISHQTRPSLQQHHRNSSVQRFRSPLPTDLITIATYAAEHAPELRSLYNYPTIKHFHLAPEYLNAHPEDKRIHDNQKYLKPTLIIEQSESANPVRVGFAATNTRPGDILLQFKGMDITLVGRKTAVGSIQLVGSAIMVKHQDLKEDKQTHSTPGVHPLMMESNWISSCLENCEESENGNREDVFMKTDCLSLFELLRRPDVL